MTRNRKVWGVLGLLLALVVVVGYGQIPVVPKAVTVSGTVCKLNVNTAAQTISCDPTPDVSVTLINASTGLSVGSATSSATGSFTISNVPQGIYVYAVLSKSGFKTTDTFAINVTGDISGVRLPIVEANNPSNYGSYNYLVYVLAPMVCGVTQNPAKSIIFTLFSPSPWDGNPANLYGGAVVDAYGIYNPWPKLVPGNPPGDRRYIGFKNTAPYIVCRDQPGIPPGGGDVLIPKASLIFNADRNPHSSSQAVKAYAMKVKGFWPGLVPCQYTTTEGMAPTPHDITVGQLNCSIGHP